MNFLICNNEDFEKTLAVLFALFMAVIVAHTVTIFAIEFINQLNNKI